MRPLNFFVLMGTFLLLFVLLNNNAYFWAALLLGSVQMLEYILSISED